MAETNPNTTTDEAQETEAPKQASRKTTKRKAATIKIRGRVSTTELAQDEVVEVERTETIDRLMANGLVEEVKD